jgi:DNA repair exonuclease SbcCD ATPase subunit
MQQQYQAAMAVRTAPVGTMPVTRMNAQQLGAERTALMSAIAATSGVKGYEGKAAGYEQRLKAVNEQLKLLTDNEKKADQAAKQLQATQEAAGTVRAVYRGQAVELEKLQAAYRTLQARQQQFAGTNDAKARAAAQQMALLKNRIDKVTAAMQAEIKIDKQFLKTATNAQLQNALTQLQQKLQSLNSTQSATAQKLKQDMKAVEAQIRRNTGAIQQQGGTFGTAIKNIAAYVGVFGAFNMIKSKVMEVYKSNLKLSDSLADIRKVSGLTSEEINKLYNNISKIDSRNTIETLNKLAYTGAKLGIGQNYGVQGLTGFVRAAEQVQMALGEDLG